VRTSKTGSTERRDFRPKVADRQYGAPGLQSERRRSAVRSAGTSVPAFTAQRDFTMRTTITLTAVLALLAVGTADAQTATAAPSKTREHVEALASPALEGRL